MEKSLLQKIYDIISSMEHRRFATIDELCNQIGCQNGVYKINLVEDDIGEIVCDNFLIGTIGVVKDDETLEYDIQLYYIKDNLGNYYITETELLQEVI